MRLPKIRIPGPSIAAGIGAGLAAALLSMLVAQRTSFALAMGFVAPLPIMIAALGFGSLAGGIAAVVGCLAVGLVDMRPEGLVLVLPNKLASAGIDVLVFAVGLGIPAWLLGRLAALDPKAPDTVDARGTARPDERRLGRIVGAAIGFAAAGIALDLVVSVVKQGGFKPFLATTVTKIEPLVQRVLSANRPLPSGLSTHDVALGVAWAQMPMMAGADVVLLVFNLWLAARIAQTSGLLSGRWPDIPGHLRLPRPLALALAVALGLTFAGGLVGMLSLIVSGALLVGFALQGLAVIHAVTRDKSYRTPLLIIVYLSMAMLMPWLIVFYGLLGLVDTAVSFRDRRRPEPPPPGPWQRTPPTKKN